MITAGSCSHHDDPSLYYSSVTGREHAVLLVVTAEAIMGATATASRSTNQRVAIPHRSLLSA